MTARFIFVRFLLACGIAASSLLSAQPAGEESRSPWVARPTLVTRQEVWQAVVDELGKRGLSELQLPRVEDLDLPVALRALDGRSLRVSSTCWDEGLGRTRFRLQCREPKECLPFLVYVRDFREEDRNADSCRLPSPRPAAQARPIAVVRAGERATAVFVADRLRMTASVTCLERGNEGAIIRVRSQDGHVFRARISGPALLEALPQ